MAQAGSLDIAIAGGGLAGGLIALALHQRRPDLRVALIEGGETLGGNHIWSYFDSDVGGAGRALLAPLTGQSWDGYEVRFPGHRRTLDTRYNSIRSDHYDAALREILPADAIRIGATIIGVSPTALVLDSGERIEAGGVIDCRGAGDLTLLALGWQKFAGVELDLEAPHGLDRPIVMDATVEQIDGYRFVYSLPLSATQIFVEDTYYSDLPAMDAGAIEQRALAYAESQGWKVADIVHREKGMLPVAQKGGDFAAYWRSGGKAGKAGVRAGLFHPTTGYSLPDAVRTAQFVAGLNDLSGAALHDALFDYAGARWRERGFYRLLDTMMFKGADTPDRYKILERFYRLDPALIERFYAASSHMADKLRIVSGKPPIPVSRGLRALWGKQSA